MKAITREWLDRALDDLSAASALLTHPDLTHLSAFHAQQTVEKALKAVIEEYELGLIRTHSLTRLHQVASERLMETMDRDMLDRLEAVYIEARYPSELGLLPYGKPSAEDAAAFHAFARTVYEQISKVLDAGVR
jgi:HEPN domain-containing protein